MKKINFKGDYDVTGEITLIGYGLTKSVFINGVNMQLSGIDWGFSGPSSRLLAREILKKFVDPERAESLVEDFTASIIALLPRGNFGVILKLDYWLRASEYTGSKLLHSYGFVDVYLPSSNFRFSMFLDFPNMDIKDGEFKEGTIEYELVSKMSSQEFSMYKEYIYTKSKRKGLIDASKDVTASLEVGAGVFSYTEGLGANLSNGHKMDLYEY